MVHLVEERPVAVFDAKYKLESPTSRYPNADAYQMLAYCTALHVPAGWLLYAQGSGPARTRRIRHTGIDVIHHPLDLTASPDHILADIRRVAATAMGGQAR
ncbi:5-methylcytosine-specific restriction endonuclease McrBC regulatory subunit McrC [Catenuloplanes atrovinosus]|uniref:5-methylcytosine-specific restriction endonuclease McrBC regulatory subunit McrC n=1 Tax=Catenuloplanes atrovinosus TaxID=137266 RepID=A0AAE3YR11_9ACTN|nr:5-methylcytosine-specific restriction endonuclease McrBC regulatory subunit McrC [Catenuloplanes atrovinosus]